ncbi:MAG: Ig-like domain-containing protein [Ruminococcus sp.]|nr:Ig-like domain-containing protein [Ruminococcus sp.]
MKNLTKRIAALAAASVMCLTMYSPVFAEFTDPAQAYGQFTERGVSDESSDDGAGEAYTENTDEEEAAEITDESENANESGVSREDKDSEKKVTVPAEEITVYSYRSTVTEGDTFTVRCRLKPSNSDDTITYSTTNSKIASVDSDGNVTAVSKGTAIISAKTSSGVKDRFSLTVKATAPAEEGEDSSEDEDREENGGETESSENTEKTDSTSKTVSIELKHSSVTLYSGDTYKIIYELTPEGSSDTVSFRSVNKSVASVDSKGNVTAVGEGNTRIVCTASNGRSAKLNVTVIPVLSEAEQDKIYNTEAEKEYDEDGNLVPSMVRFLDESASVQIGSKFTLDARVYPSGSKYTYTIQSSNSSVAKVNSKGEVTGISQGSALITLTTDNGKTDSIYVTVYGDIIPGIDVSKWNGEIDWKRVKESGKAQFAMIRASYGYEDTDPMLRANVSGCEQYGIPYGFYHYTYAKNAAEAKKEAAYFLNVISEYSPQYPVVLDIEESFYKEMSPKDVTLIATTFIEELENAGYYAMIYSFAKFFNDCLIIDKIKDYDIWVACWGDEDKLAENYSYHYGMWQYTETGRINGIEEYVDLNYAYKDYRATIEKYGLNRPRFW